MEKCNKKQFYCNRVFIFLNDLERIEGKKIVNTTVGHAGTI